MLSGTDGGPGFGRFEPARHTGTASNASMQGASDVPVSSMIPSGNLLAPPMEGSTGPITLRFACVIRCDDEMATSASATNTAQTFAEIERPRFGSANESITPILLRALRALSSTACQMHQHVSGSGCDV